MAEIIAEELGIDEREASRVLGIILGTMLVNLAVSMLRNIIA